MMPSVEKRRKEEKKIASRHSKQLINSLNPWWFYECSPAALKPSSSITLPAGGDSCVGRGIIRRRRRSCSNRSQTSAAVPCHLEVKRAVQDLFSLLLFFTQLASECNPFRIETLGVINGTAKECSVHIHIMAGSQIGDRHDQSRVGRIPAECLIASYICLSKCRV